MQRPQVRTLEHLGHGAMRYDAAGGQQHRIVCEACDLVDVVSHVEHRDPEDLGQRFDVRKDLPLALHVERRERFVQKQEPRAREQCARNRHALLLAAGQRRRAAREQRGQVERLDRILEVDRRA